MADTQRTKAELLALMADNVTGQISAQDFRDFMVTGMEQEFINPGDFFKQPDADATGLTNSDRAMRGWFDYSQIVDSDVSFGNALYMTASNTWKKAEADTSAMNPCHGLAADSYLASASNCKILRRGLVYQSALSLSFTSTYIGKPVFLAGSDSYGSVKVTISTNTSVVVLGFVEMTSGGLQGCWRFCPTDWAVKGT